MNTSRPAIRWNRQRSVHLVLFLIPIAFLFIVYWYGLKNWFEQDDFAWLSLHSQVYSVQSFLTAMFAPMAQGTIRPWSERGFFLLFYQVFQSNALAYHIAVFVTQAANLVLLALILLKLTGSRLAATLAPILWTANSALLTPLCWVSDYNQIQCLFFLLLAFLLYVNGRYWLQFTVFVLGFGALELNIVYPAIVLAYVLTCRFSRSNVLRTIPLFLVSVIYFAIHTLVAPRQSTGVYALHFDQALPATLGTYWTWTFAPVNAHQPFAVVLLFTIVVIGFVSYQTWRGHRLPLFFLLWFFLTLAPTLPLRDHISDYYLAIPTLGIGCVLALALSTRSTTAPNWLRLAALAPVVFYLFVQIPLDRFGARWYFSHTRAVRNLVWGVRQARELHPGKTILLTGVSDDLYVDAVAHSVFRALDIPDVYLAPESTAQVERLDNENPDATGYILPAGPTVHALLKENLVVYSAAGERLKNVTSSYERTAEQRFGWDTTKNTPRRIDVASALMAYLLGPTWYSPDGNFRWMPSRASFRIGVPLSGTSLKLLLAGYCPPEQTQSEPVALSVSVDGKKLSDTTIRKPETSFSRTFSLPRDLAGRESVEVTLAVSRSFEGSGGVSRALAFSTFEIR